MPLRGKRSCRRCLVELHGKARHRSHAGARYHELVLSICLRTHDVVRTSWPITNLCPGGVAARSPSDDLHSNPACARFDAAQGFGGRHAQFVMAVRGKDDFSSRRHVLQTVSDQIGASRVRYSHGIRRWLSLVAPALIAISTVR